jgi:hypothetical protein
VKNQVHLTWIKRAVLVDWMMLFIEESGSSREIFAKSVSLLDLYLSKKNNVNLRDLQLIGATCMLISSKLEGKAFHVNSIFEACGSKYELEEFLELEASILMVLSWKTNQPTCNMWANRLVKQWDDYL